MKNLYFTLAFILLLSACNQNTENPIIDEDPIITTNLSGKLQCLNGTPLGQLEITLSGLSGNNYTTSTDANGNYLFENIEEDNYTINFEDLTVYDYSSLEFNAIYSDLEDIVLNVREKTNIDHIAYNLINYEEGLTTYDMVLFDRLNNGDDLVEEIEMPWRYILTSELETNPAITNQLSVEVTASVELDITAIQFGDITGFTCQ